MKKSILITSIIVVVLAIILGISIPASLGSIKKNLAETTTSTILEAFETENVDTVLSAISTYEKKLSDTEYGSNIEQAILSQFDSYCSDLKYSKFTFMDKLIERLKSNKNAKVISLTKKAQKILDDNSTNRLLAALQGTWKRQDSSSLSGSIFEVKTNGKSTSAVIAYAVSNPYEFKVGDLKWKNLTCINETMFTFEDLSKSSDRDYRYVSSTGTYNFETDTIEISIARYGDGSVQHLVRADSASEISNNTPPASNDDYLFPSNTTYITEEDLIPKTKEEVAMLRNEIYARHGYIFQTEPYKSYFESKSWYSPNNNFDENSFSAIERANKDFIVEYETKMGWK